VSTPSPRAARASAREEDAQPADGATRVRMRFLPEGAEVRVPSGTPVFDAASWNGIAIDSTCGGHGTCKKCKVRIVSGEVQVGELGRNLLFGQGSARRIPLGEVVNVGEEVGDEDGGRNVRAEDAVRTAAGKDRLECVVVLASSLLHLALSLFAQHVLRTKEDGSVGQPLDRGDDDVFADESDCLLRVESARDYFIQMFALHRK